MKFKNIKLKEILLLQDFGAFPDIWRKTGLPVAGHPGLDLNWGHLDPVYSFTDGKVVYADKEMGTVVILKDNLEYSYSHLENVGVSAGQDILRGATIGLIDSKGKSIQGQDWSHLHFGLREIEYKDEPQKLSWNFPAFSPIKYKILNELNGFEGYIDPNRYCEKVIERVAKAIETFEKMKPEYNNPGALRYSYLQLYQKNGFAVFVDYQTGWKALIHQLTISANGKSSYYKPSGTVLDFCKVYAPSSDNNNPQNYANFIINYCGFKGGEPISDWLLTELEWVRKYNSVSKGQTWWVADIMIKAFNKLWGIIWKN